MGRRHEWTDPETGITFYYGTDDSNIGRIIHQGKPPKSTQDIETSFFRYSNHLAAELDRVTVELAKVLAVSREVSKSGISYDAKHPSIDYVEVQVDAEEWKELKRLVAEEEEEEE